MAVHELTGLRRSLLTATGERGQTDSRYPHALHCTALAPSVAAVLRFYGCVIRLQVVRPTRGWSASISDHCTTTLWPRPTPAGDVCVCRCQAPCCQQTTVYSPRCHTSAASPPLSPTDPRHHPRTRSVTPSLSSCSTTLPRLLRRISGKVCSCRSFLKLDSVYRRKHFPGRVRPARPERWWADACDQGGVDGVWTFQEDCTYS